MKHHILEASSAFETMRFIKYSSMDKVKKKKYVGEFHTIIRALLSWIAYHCTALPNLLQLSLY